MAGFDNDVVYANNADFSVAGAGGGSAANGLQLDGQLWTGSTVANVGGTHVNVGNITSPLGTLSIGYSSPNITLDLAGGSTAIERIALQTGTTPITPVGGAITFNGAVVAAGTNPVRTDGTGASTMALEVQISQALAATDATKIGLCNFDSAAFDVDANGFVQLNGGGIATTSFDVQANTAPGTDPVVPTAAGVVTVNGAAVANHSVVLETRSRAANAYNLEIQYATSAAATDATKSGVSHFQSAQFSVDANGFVSLVGGAAPAANSFPTDTGTSVPSATGVLNVKGQTTPNTSGIQTVTAANEIDVRMLTPYTLGDFSFDTSTAASTRSLQVQNTDNTSATSSARQNILVGGTSAGDPWTQYTIGTARSWSIGIDNSDGDTVKFTTDSDATVDPSSGTFISAFTTSGGFESGLNASGTSNANVFGSFRKDQNDSSIVSVNNSTAGTAAVGEFQTSCNSNTIALQSISNAYTVDTRIADRARIRSFNGAGIDILVNAGDFRIYTGNPTILWAISSAIGEWNFPLQPAFLAYNSADDAGTKGGTQNIDFDTEVFDQGANFAADTFTAPVTGKYHLYTNVTISGINAATRAELYIVTSNRTYQLAAWNPTTTITTGSVVSGYCGAVLADMDAADTAIVQLIVDGGTPGYTIEGQATLVTSFSGKLAC